ALALELPGAPEHEMIVPGKRRLPARLDHDGLMRLDDDSGAGNGVAGPELIAREYVRAVPAAVGEEAGAARGRGRPRGREFGRTFAKGRAAADRLDRHGLDDELLAAVDEAEARFVRTLEGGFHLCLRRRGQPAARYIRQREGWHDKCRVGARISNMCACEDLDPVPRDALTFDLTDRLLGERAADAGDGCNRLDRHPLPRPPP